MNRDFPHDDNAEQILLGNCILTESAAPLSGLDLSMFYRSNNQRVGMEILAMVKAGEPVTIERLAQRLHGKVPASYIAALPDGMPVYNDLTFYRRLIIQLAGCRQGALAAHALEHAYLSAIPERIREAIRNFESATLRGSSPGASGIHDVSLKEFLAMEIKPRAMLLDPAVPEQGLVMLYSKRGVGKTHLALGIAAAVASGTKFLRWTAHDPQPALCVDGELPASLLQKRIAETVLSVGADADAVGENLRIVTPDLQECGIPDLSTREGQAAFEPCVEGAKLVIIDNLSALCRTGDENEAQAWLPLQDWALRQRREGKSVLFVHHAGHQGKNKRGTSKREDLFDTVIALRHPRDYNPVNRLLAEVHFEKTRHFHGEDAKPFTVELATGDSGGTNWVTQNLDETQFNKASRLFSENAGIRDVMEELGVSRPTASRLQKRFRESQVSLPMA
ncbi:MAG: AAA family ATPase [Acidobacteria bacterium]|nr:AAA family ATPase [Acidobacteriota bacterium]